jgi:hypothetical protein
MRFKPQAFEVLARSTDVPVRRTDRPFHFGKDERIRLSFRRGLALGRYIE